MSKRGPLMLLACAVLALGLAAGIQLAGRDAASDRCVARQGQVVGDHCLAVEPGGPPVSVPLSAWDWSEGASYLLGIGVLCAAASLGTATSATPDRGRPLRA